jgi:hypothetical protein
MFDNVWHVVNPATEVARGLQHFIKHKVGHEYLELMISNGHDDKEVIRIQPLLRKELPLSADGSQIIQCLDINLRPVDIVLPPVDQRSTKKAWAVVGNRIQVPDSP